MAGKTYTRQGESKAESLDRHWQELLQELRVAQAGTQILFAFLLTIAFTQPFREGDDLTHRVYAVTLILASLATALLIGAVPFHRMLFRQRLRDQRWAQLRRRTPRPRTRRRSTSPHRGWLP